MSAPVLAEAPSLVRSRVVDYVDLTKPRIAVLVLFTVAAAVLLASGRSLDVLVLVNAVCGTALVAAGASALNQWLEADTDAQMKRTADRPIPTGKVAPGSAFVLGMLMCIASLFLLFAKVHALAALFTLLTNAS